MFFTEAEATASRLPQWKLRHCLCENFIDPNNWLPSTLYTTIPYEKIKPLLKEIIPNAFYFKMVDNTLQVYSFGSTFILFCQARNEGQKVLQMKPSVKLGGHIFQVKNHRHPMATKCALSLSIFSNTHMSSLLPSLVFSIWKCH